MSKIAETIHFFFISDRVNYCNFNRIQNKIIEQKIISVKTSDEIDLEQKKPDAQTFFILSKSLIIEKQLSLPSTNITEIEEMAGMQAVKMAPFSQDEIITHFDIIKSSDDGHSLVNVYILPKVNILQNLSLILEKGFIPDRLILSPISIFNYAKAKNLNSNNINNYIYLWDECIEAGIFSSDKLITSKLFFNPETAPQLTYEDVLEYLAHGAKKHGIQISKESLIIGAPKDIQPFKNKTNNLVPVPYTENDYLSFISKEHKKFSFIINDIEDLKKTKSFKLAFYRIFIIFIIFLCGIISYLHIANRNIQNKVTEISSKIEMIENKALVLRKRKEQISIFAEHFLNINNYVNSVVEIFKIFPEGTHLTLVNFIDSSKFRIKGVSKKNVIQLVQTLEDSNLFKNISLKYQNRLKNNLGIEFHIVGEFEKGL